MNGLTPDQQRIKESLESRGISVFVGKEWNQLYLSVPLTAGKEKNHTISARFSFVDGQPALSELPRKRYICVRIPRFYHWQDDLSGYKDLLRKANSVAYSLMNRDVYLDFFIDYIDFDIIFFRMDVPLKENEEIGDAVTDVFYQLGAMVQAVYSFFEHYDVQEEAWYDDDETDEYSEEVSR